MNEKIFRFKFEGNEIEVGVSLEHEGEVDKWGGVRDRYKATVKCHGGKFQTVYHKSVNDFMHGRHGVELDDLANCLNCIVLDALAYHDYPHIYDFAQAFGTTSEDVFNACKEAYDNLCYYVSRDVEVLQKIAEACDNEEYEVLE